MKDTLNIGLVKFMGKAHSNFRKVGMFFEQASV